MEESRKISRLMISPSRITARPGEEIDIAALVYDEKEKCLGSAENPMWRANIGYNGVIGAVFMNSGMSGGPDDSVTYRVKACSEPGRYTIGCTVYSPKSPEVVNKEDKTLDDYDKIEAEAELLIINEKTGEVPEPELVSQKRSRSSLDLKRVSDFELLEKTEQCQHVPRTVIGHTRAIFRTLGSNKDLVWLGACLICATALGASAIMAIYDVNIDRILYLITSLLGVIFTTLAKVYTPPGEISESISERISGISPEEKLATLETKIKQLRDRIYNSSRGVKTFYKYTMDESTANSSTKTR